jgi:hypothetical protein
MKAIFLEFTIYSFMIIKLVGSGTEITELEALVKRALSELALDDSVKVETTDDSAYKMDL